MNNPVFAQESTPTFRRAPSGLGAVLIGQEEEELLLDVVRNRRLFRYSYDLSPEEQGKMAATLEREIRAKIGVKHALGVTSGTAALETALGAMEVGPGDEVIVPAWSWISCFTAVVRSGARPVLAEIDKTFCLAGGEIRRLTTPSTKAVIVVHYQGVAADMDVILSEAKAAGIRVLEDCAEACGALYKGRRIGSMGDMGIFSFQNQKTVTSGEGGAVVTNHDNLYIRAVRMHDLGMVRPHHALFATPEDEAFSGGQYRMNEMTAAVGVAQFRKVDVIRAHCRKIYARIMARIGMLPGLTFRHIPCSEGDSGIEIYFWTGCKETAKIFAEKLDARNVNCMKMTGTACHYDRQYCLNRSTAKSTASPFRDFAEWPAPGYRAVDFPRTEDLVRRFVALPLGVLYTEEDADHIAESVIEVHKELGIE